MKRRDFIITLAGLAPDGHTPRCAAGQDARIGILSPARSEGPDASRPTLNALVEGLRELGYTEGQNIVIERRLGNRTRIDSANSLLKWSNASLMSLSR